MKLQRPRCVDQPRGIEAMNPIDKTDGIITAVLAIVVLLLIEGCIAMTVEPPAKSSAQMARAEETWKW